MGNIFLIIAVLEAIFVIMFANYNVMSDLKLGIMYTNVNFTISFFAFCILLFVFGITAGVLIMLKAVLRGARQTKDVKRKLEKTSIGADDSELKIRTLENKVKTLEAALDKVIKKED